MCEMSEERTYYIRTSLMYTDLTREVLFKVFKYLIKSEDITGFLSSLEQQNILKELFKKKVINRYDYDLVSGQVLNLERLDISLLIRLILNLCKDNIPKPQRGWKTKLQPKDESLCADLLRLRDVRNKIIGHRADAKLSEAEYEKTWAKIKAILLRVVELVDSTSRENCERRINEYRRLNVDTENAEVKRLLDELLKYKEEFDHLQEKVEELSRTSNEFQVYFKITPERFVRYIKLLFDGGRIVLCGILEKKLGDKDLSEFLEKKKETLIRNIEEKFSSCLYPQESCSDYNNWDVFLLASVLLLTFDDELSQNEIMYIGRIRSARVNYASLALQSLDTDAFLTSWTDLINCLNHLSINIAEDDKQQVEHLIERYKKKGEEGCDVEEYLKRLRESGVEVKTLNDVYNETITELKDILNQLSQNHIKFKEEHVLEFKLLTTCENEEIKKRAEDLLEINLQASIQNLDQHSDIVRGETDKLVASIAAHPDVKPVEVKRKCIILSFKCSTPGGLLHILNTTQGDQFRSTFRNIANELYYIYGYAFLIQGKYTLESVSRLSRMINKSTTNEGSSEYIRIPLKCSSVDGVKSVLSAIKREKRTNSLNRIAEQMSAEFNETVSIKLIPEMMEFRNVFGDTDSEGSSSLDSNEDETEEIVPGEMGNKKDDVNHEEQVDFIAKNKSTFVHADETDREVVQGHADDEKTRIRDVTVDGKINESELEHIRQLPTRRIYDQSLQQMFYSKCIFVDEAARYLKEGLQGCIINFSKENFKQLRLKVLNIENTKECNICRLDKLLPVHSSQRGRCPLGQAYCSCVSGDKIRCPSNFCDVMYDEIIKQHRSSSNRYFAPLNVRNWHENHWEVTKFYISNKFTMLCGSIEHLQCVDYLDIMVNNLAFQKEISCQIDPPSDVVSKIRSYLRDEVDTDDYIFKDVIHNMITILTSIINQMQSTRIAVQKLQQLERRYDEEHMFIHPGFQNESDKLKESIKKRQPSFTSVQEKMGRFPSKSVEVDIREKQYKDTTKKTGIHVKDIGFETEDPILLYEEADKFMQAIFDAEISCTMMTGKNFDITESKLLILQDKIEYLIQASETSAAISFQHQNLGSLRKEFLNIKEMFLSGVAKHDKEYQTKKEEFQRFLSIKERIHYKCDTYEYASLESLYLYSQECERICSEKDIFYQRGSLSKNIVVSGSTSNCKRFCEFLICNRHQALPSSKFEYVFVLSMGDVKETHIHDMIKNHILGNKYVPFFEQMLLREADKCLIILEGLDQWKPNELVTKSTPSSIALSNYKLPRRNHMSDYVVLVTTEDKNIENIKLAETDKVLYLMDSDSDRFCNLL